MKTKQKPETVRKTPLGIEKRFDRFGEWLDTSWAIKKAKPIFDRYPKVILTLTWIMRLIVGGTFIVSGLSKGIDPWGTFYKMSEYLSAMHIPISELGNTVLSLAFLLFSIEFIIGACLLTGCFRKATPIMASLFMLVMLPLTLWIAIADPVADCGCFGDFLKISNWATFIKNVFLSLAAVWLLKFNKSAGCLITPYLQWIAAVGMSAYIMTVAYIGYWQQPLVDFRPYKVGTQLIGVEEDAEFLPVFEFIYEKDGKEHVFSEDDDLPVESEGWKFVRREEKSFVKNNDSGSSAESDNPDFRIWNETGDEDVTEILSSTGDQTILLIPDITDLSMATSWKINRLYDISEYDGTDFFAIAAGSPEEIEEWRDLSSGQYAIYTSEDTSIKELARGNPALVRLSGGRIVWKTALSALNLDDNDNDSMEERVISTSILRLERNGLQILTGLSLILLSFLAALALISFLRFR